MSNVPISVATTDGSVAITGKATGTPPTPLPPGPQKAGVSGSSDSGFGMVASSQSGTGIDVQSNTGTAVWAASATGEGVHSQSNSSHGVHGINGPGATAKPDKGCGVWGESDSGLGVAGYSQTGLAVVGVGGALAGYFVGDIEVTDTIIADKDVTIKGMDCAEAFAVSEQDQIIEPGTVMVIDESGSLQRSQRAYDRRVAGVVSGAGDCKPGIILGAQRSQDNLDCKKVPMALVGTVYCMVDAKYSPVEVGDLLTTSPTPGHAMKANDYQKAFGAVLGKALRPLLAGQDLILILVALQ